MKTLTSLLMLFYSVLTANAARCEDEKHVFHPKPAGTVVLVHGFLRSSMNMYAFSHSFKKEGWNVVNWSYPSRRKLIEEHADDLVSRLKIIANCHPNEPISFVTHSMGALVLRCALNHSECPDEAKIGRAVLIAPPNRGSSFARSLHRYKPMRWLLGEKSGHQLMTTSPDGFDRMGNFPGDMPVLVISGTAGWNPAIGGVNDGKVGLQETCLQTPHYHASSYAGHSWICLVPSVVKKAKKFLSSGA
ncbi:MAG: alpha/beta hydrolase [Waddliaceae bacterium]